MRELQTIQFKPLQGTELWAQALEMDVQPNRESPGQWDVGDATVEFYSHGDRYKAVCHNCTDSPCIHIVRTGMEAIPKGLDIPSASNADRPEEAIPEDGQKQVTDVPESAADDDEDSDGEEGQPSPEEAPQTAEPVQKTDGGVVETETNDSAPVPDEALENALEEPDPRNVDTDPLEWIPEQFIDKIDGTPAINKKGFSVLCQHYGISVDVEKTVGPMETDFSYAECRAVARTPDGEEYVSFGSAHTKRGDDPSMLLEYADTRAFKRAASRATGTGMLAVEELQNG